MEITESFNLEKTSKITESNHESISDKARIAARQPNPSVPPWEGSLGLGMLEIVGTTWKDRGAGTKQQESTDNTPLWNPWNCCERGCLSLLLLQAQPQDDDPSLHQTLLQDFAGHESPEEDTSGKYGSGLSHIQFSVHWPILGIAILYPKLAQGLDVRLRARSFHQKPTMRKNKP